MSYRAASKTSNNSSNKETLALINNSVNHHRKMSNFSVTMLNSVIPTCKTHTRFTFKTNQSSDRHPRSAYRKLLLLHRWLKMSVLVSQELFSPLKNQLSTDLRKWRTLLWDHTSKSWAASNKQRVQFLMLTSLSKETISILGETNESESRSVDSIKPLLLLKMIYYGKFKDYKRIRSSFCI